MALPGSRLRARFDELLVLVPVEPLTREDAGLYATIRSALEKKQQGIGPMDTLIAAQALRLPARLSSPTMSASSAACLT